MKKNNNNNFEKLNPKKFVLIVATLIATICICTLPMKLCPLWNGDIPDHRNQYEIFTESLLKGHLYMDYGEIDEKLLNMENPYDPQKRGELQVSFHWDHSFYYGKYYMYFGVAPVFLAFLPYRIITGHALVTYHATQLFAAAYIIGMFFLLYHLSKYFFKKMNFGCYLILAAALSMASIWICVDQPALYSTAIISGLCMAIWSLSFFIKSVYGDYSENKAIFFAIIGAIFGALTFACRPPIGLINLLMIPMLIDFYKKYGFNKRTILKTILVLVPYIIVGALIMIYNYVRFDNVFEFGQSYQLTMTDQHNYLNIISRIKLTNICKYVRGLFFDNGKFTNVFPYVGVSGIFFNFPILVTPYLFIFDEKFRKNLKDKKIFTLYVALMILPLFVAIFDSIEAPKYGERYRLDVYYILAILTYIGFANYHSVRSEYKEKKNKAIKLAIIILSSLTIIKATLLFFVPRDGNFTDYYKDINPRIDNKIKFWKK